MAAALAVTIAAAVILAVLRYAEHFSCYNVGRLRKNNYLCARNDKTTREKKKLWD